MPKRTFVRPYGRALLAFPAFLLLAFAATASAQVTGKVIGTVTDRDTGQPLVGAQVVIDATNLGNVSNEDGYYFVNNVPVGVQSVVAQYLGYQTTSQEQRILAGQTMTVNFALSSEVVQAEGIVAVIEREPLVARDNTISKSRFTGEEARDLPVDNLTEVITLGAGIYQGQGGFVIRGGRGSESATFVDGVLITDFASQRNNSDVGNFAVEEVDVITGGFNAEFGNAQSGIVNIVTREGGREYHGSVRYTTDGQFGTTGYDFEDLVQADPDALETQKCCGFNSLQASIGGPIIPEKLTFFGSMDVSAAADWDPRSAGFNPAVGAFNSTGSTETILPANRGDETRAQAKLSSTLFPNSRVTATYLFSRSQQELYQNSATARGLMQWMDTAQRVKTHDLIVGYDQQLFQTAERNLNLQVRGNIHQTKLFQGTPVNPRTAELMAVAIGDECADQCDVTEYGFEADFLNYRISDVEFFFEDAVPGSLPRVGGFNTGSRDPDPIFGHANTFITEEGLSNFFRRRNERRYGLRVDLDSQINRVHRGKIGADMTWINLYTADQRFSDATFANLFDVDPRVLGLYAQDRLDYGDLVIDLGLRYDRWDPNTVFPLFAGVVPCEISAFDQCSPEAESLDAPVRDEWAPRLGVAHPITDNTQVRLSYGKFFQLPELRHYFSGYSTDFVASAGNPNITYGNPHLDYVETTAFEAGITHLITENLVLDVVGYNRDRRGAIRLDVFQPGDISAEVEERRIFLNGDNGNVKGFDITLNKRFSNYFSTDLAWSLQWARGTTSSPTSFATGSGFGRLFDPINPGRLLVPPSELQPEEFDRLHSINYQFSLRLPGDFREGTTLGRVFENFSMFMTYNAHSGEPFTRRTTEGQGEALEDIGSSRLPWVHQGDVRFTKGFGISEALHLDVFAFVENFLDIQNVIAVNPTSGRPDLSGFEADLSQDPVIAARFKVEGAPDGYPIDVNQILPEWQDRIGRQDLDGNGTITLDEGRESLRRALIASGEAGNVQVGQTGDSVFNYGTPRLLRFGAELRF